MIRAATRGLALAAACLAPLAAPAAAAARDPLPWSVESLRYGDRSACHVDTAHHLARIWWSEQRVPGRLPGSDGRCSTRPHLATLMRGKVEWYLAREHALGLPRPATDAWITDFDFATGREVVANGGSPALDIYLNGASGGGIAQCLYAYGSGQPARTASYVMLASATDRGARTDPTYLEVLAHELGHVGQCAWHDNLGRNGTSGALWIVEGTANVIANAAVPSAVGRPGAFFGESSNTVVTLLDQVGHGSQTVFGAVGGHEYDTWPFWFSLTDGMRRSGPLLSLYTRVAATPSGHRARDIPTVRKAFRARDLQRALLAGARFSALGGSLATVHVPYDTWWAWRRDATGTPPTLGGVGATAKSRAVKVAAGGQAWLRVRPADPTGATLAIHVTGRDAAGRALLATGVLVGDMRGRTVAPTSAGRWRSKVWPLPTFQTPTGTTTTRTETGDGEAWVVFANAGTTAATFTVAASAAVG